MMRTLVTPAVLPPAALAELKDWLGIAAPSDDAQLAALLRAGLELCEHFTGTMPLEQGCELVLPASTAWQELTTRPVQAIDAVLGIPAEGARFTLPVSAYALELTATGAGRVLVFEPGAAGRIAVRFTAGLVSAWENLPDALRHGIMRYAAHQYRARETDDAAALPAAVAALWRPWRWMRLT